MRPFSLAHSSSALAVGLSILVVAGCGSSGDRLGAATSGRTSQAGATQAQTQSLTGATVGTTTTSTSQTSTVPGASSLPGTGKPTVTIGDKNYTEQFVLGQLYLQALQAQGFTVNINQNLGPPAVYTRGLKSGQLAMYPEYLDTFDASIAGYRHGFATQLQAYEAAQRWAGRHGLQLLAPTPFSDTDAIGVTVAYAAQHRLGSLLDLRRVGAMLTLGGAAQFATGAPGLPVLSSVYGVTPARFKALAVGDQYTNLDDGSVQAAYVNSTDGELATGDYRLLRDPERIFGWGNVVPVVSAAALAKQGPAFAVTIERVDAALTVSVMRSLNAAVDLAKKDPATVAKQFLETHGLLAPLPS